MKRKVMRVYPNIFLVGCLTTTTYSFAFPLRLPSRLMFLCAVTSLSVSQMVLTTRRMHCLAYPLRVTILSLNVTMSQRFHPPPICSARHHASCFPLPRQSCRYPRRSSHSSRACELYKPPRTGLFKLQHLHHMSWAVRAVIFQEVEGRGKKHRRGEDIDDEVT